MTLRLECWSLGFKKYDLMSQKGVFGHLIKAWWISVNFCFLPKFGSVKKKAWKINIKCIKYNKCCM